MLDFHTPIKGTSITIHECNTSKNSVSNLLSNAYLGEKLGYSLGLDYEGGVSSYHRARTTGVENGAAFELTCERVTQVICPVDL